MSTNPKQIQLNHYDYYIIRYNVTCDTIKLDGMLTQITTRKGEKTLYIVFQPGGVID